MNSNDFVDMITKKFNYSIELQDYLKKVIPALITYYGEERKDTIYRALNECEIHIQGKDEDCNEYLKNYFNRQSDLDLPLSAGAFYETCIQLKGNRPVLKPIIYLRTIWLRDYVGFDFNDENKMSTLTHEICHAIKGYGKLREENGVLTDMTGLCKSYYKLNKVTGEFIEEKSINTGLEEAFNCYDEKEIMTIMTGKKREFGAYVSLTQLADMLAEIPNLLKAVQSSQFSGGSEWIEFLSPIGAKFISENMEMAYLPFVSDLVKEGVFEKVLADQEMAEDNLVAFIDAYKKALEEAHRK